MYKLLIRPLLFLIYPEKVHHLIVVLVKVSFKIPGIQYIVEKLCTVSDTRLEREVLGVHFKNPVGLAAGFDKNAEFFNEFSTFGFSHIEIGTVTPKAQGGNPKPRSFRLTKDNALINRMGFNNKGVDNAVKNLTKKRSNIIIGGNIGKNTTTPNDTAVNDYVYNCEYLYDFTEYTVVNVSCPNISDLHKLQDQESLELILENIVAVRKAKAIYKPILLKLSPDLNKYQIDETLTIVQKHGIDGVIVSNTTVSRESLKTNEAVVKKIGKGGLSGQPIKDRSTDMIRYIAEKTNKKLTIIGVGGIMSPKDAIEKLDAGASLIQIYTGFIYEGVSLVKRINKTILKTYHG